MPRSLKCSYLQVFFLKTDVHKIFNSDTDGYLWFVIKLNKYIILSGPRPITGLCLLI
jgi:hypothetical protein